MGKKAQSSGCDSGIFSECGGSITDLFNMIIGFISQLLNFVTCGNLGLKLPLLPFKVGVPLGPLGVVSVIAGALATNVVSFTMAPLSVALAGLVLVGLLVYKLR